MSIHSRPSPAMVIAVVALSFALAGTAVAGPDSLTRAVTKSKVKKIAKKQANKAIDQREGSLNVKSADTADRLANVTVQKEEFEVLDNTANGALATCPGGQQVISGGVITGANDSFITNSVPASALVGDLADGQAFTAWRGFVVNQLGGSGTITSTVYAVCAG